MRNNNSGYYKINLTRKHLLYEIHDFMQNEVAELTPEEREKYGVDDYPKD